MDDLDLAARKCQPMKDAESKLTEDRARQFLKQTPGWELVNGELRKTFPFKNYYETIAFVNAAAFISHREDHHPDMEVGYNKVTMRYSTHSVGGLSENDFICAAKVEQLMRD